MESVYIPYKKPDELIKTTECTSNYDELISSFLYNDLPECNLKLVA